MYELEEGEVYFGDFVTMAYEGEEGQRLLANGLLMDNADIRHVLEDKNSLVHSYSNWIARDMQVLWFFVSDLVWQGQLNPDFLSERDDTFWQGACMEREIEKRLEAGVPREDLAIGYWVGYWSQNYPIAAGVICKCGCGTWLYEPGVIEASCPICDFRVAMVMSGADEREKEWVEDAIKEHLEACEVANPEKFAEEVEYWESREALVTNVVSDLNFTMLTDAEGRGVDVAWGADL